MQLSNFRAINKKIRNIIILLLVVLMSACHLVGRRNNNNNSQNRPSGQTQAGQVPANNRLAQSNQNAQGGGNVPSTVANGSGGGNRRRVISSPHCSWGFVGPKKIHCLNNTYVYGSVICGIDSHKVFCQEQFTTDIRLCIADNAPNTLTCEQQTRGVRSGSSSSGGNQPEVSEIPDPSCNWGFVGPRRVQCRGKTYIYSPSVICSSKIYDQIFCEARFIYNINLCKGDNQPDTINCFHQNFP